MKLDKDNYTVKQISNEVYNNLKNQNQRVGKEVVYQVLKEYEKTKIELLKKNKVVSTELGIFRLKFVPKRHLSGKLLTVPQGTVVPEHYRVQFTVKDTLKKLIKDISDIIPRSTAESTESFYAELDEDV